MCGLLSILFVDMLSDLSMLLHGYILYTLAFRTGHERGQEAARPWMKYEAKKIIESRKKAAENE